MSLLYFFSHSWRGGKSIVRGGQEIWVPALSLPRIGRGPGKTLVIFDFGFPVCKVRDL